MDTVSKAARSRNMAAIRSMNTRPEFVVRRLLRKSGYSFQLHRRNLPGRPDIFLKEYKTAIFVNGCFWHQHKNCQYSTIPKSNRSFWIKKLRGNVLRDRLNMHKLQKMGFKVLTVWECRLRKLIKVKELALLKTLARMKKEVR